MKIKIKIGFGGAAENVDGVTFVLMTA